MGDAAEASVEEIIAEPEEIGYLQAFFTLVHLFVSAYGWYILLGGGAAYYLWKNKLQSRAGNQAKSPEEIASWQVKEEQRLKSIQRLQEKYEREAAIKAEKQKLLDEEKQRKRRAELEELTKKSDGHRLGSDTSNSTSIRPEYNPLMGDDGGSGRVCFRRPGGGSGG